MRGKATASAVARRWRRASAALFGCWLSDRGAPLPSRPRIIIIIVIIIVTLHGPLKDTRRSVGVSASLARPRAELDAALNTLASMMRVDGAAKLALEDMLDWLGELRAGLERRDAYILLLAVADVRVTQLVNGVSRDAHVVLEKRMLPLPIALAKGGRRGEHKRSRRAQRQ